MRPIRHIIVHHSAGPDTATVESIRRFHTAPPPEGRGWGGIGYHLVVRRSAANGWLVEAGRPVEQVGAHDADQNADSIGVVVLGDYSGGRLPPPPAWELLVGLLAGLCREHGLTADDLEGHREHEPAGQGTLCPGFDPARLRVAVGAALARVIGPRPSK